MNRSTSLAVRAVITFLLVVLTMTAMVAYASEDTLGEVTANQGVSFSDATARSPRTVKMGKCMRSSTDLVPLTDLGIGTYQGFVGGIYPEGANRPPGSYLDQGLRRAQLIQPLDRNGNPTESGKIGLLSIGMSNTTQEFSAFMKLVQREGTVNPHLVIVDGAQAGQDAIKVSNPSASDFRPEVDRTLRIAGLSHEQVQVVARIS